MAKQKARLKDIAERTGYGTNTVSLALRGSTRISAAAREKIAKVAEELDYVPNHIAKSLVSRRSHTVGLILHEITNPILTTAAERIQRTLAARGYGVLFASSNGSLEEEMRAIEMFRARMVDGLLIYPVRHTQLDHLQRLRDHNFPVVLLVGIEGSGHRRRGHRRVRRRLRRHAAPDRRGPSPDRRAGDAAVRHEPEVLRLSSTRWPPPGWRRSPGMSAPAPTTRSAAASRRWTASWPDPTDRPPSSPAATCSRSARCAGPSSTGWRCPARSPSSASTTMRPPATR